MFTLIFGDPFLAGRTRRAVGGKWIDLDRHDFEVRDTLLVEAGALIRPVPAWETKKSLVAVGATLEAPEWQEYLRDPARCKRPRPRSLFLSAAAVKRLKVLLRKCGFWEALEKFEVRSWVEPQLRNWFYGRLRVLQVVTSLQVGGAERVCLELSRMPECVGVAAWGAARRSPLAEPDWDLHAIPSARRMTSLLKLASRLHADVVHTHLLTAEQNAEIEKHFPLVTTIHNSRQAWPAGYEERRPGLLVGCSTAVAADLGPAARVAWNGVKVELTRRPKNTPGRIKLVAVANFRTQKRLHRLPPILKTLLGMGYKPELTVVGEVHPTLIDSKRARAMFARAVKESGLERRVKVVQTLDVSKILAGSHVFVSVSKYEGLSLAQLEALAAGLPVVATAVSGATELSSSVEQGAYVSLPVNAAARTFARAIVNVCRLPRKDRLPAQFTAFSMRRRYLSLYYRALAARAPEVNEVWLLTNNFSMGGAQSSARRLLGAWHEKQCVRAFTLQEQSPTKGTLALIKQGISVEHIAGANPRERAMTLLRKAAGGRPQALFFWNALAGDKCWLADLMPAATIEVSPGEMLFPSMLQFFDKTPPELPVRSGKDYGKLLHAAVVKYGREAGRMAEFLGKEPFVIPNGVDGIPFTPRNYDKRPLIFGTAARISPQKRLEDLVDAFSGLSVPLLIAGRIERGAEDYAAELKRRSAENIRWVGEQDVKKFLRQLDVFVMVADPAGCPNASLEALHSGLPVIITDVGGANEQVIDGMNGWLVERHDPAAIRAAVVDCLAQPSSTLRVMAKASSHHSRIFSVEKMLQSYMALVPGSKASRIGSS